MKLMIAACVACLASECWGQNVLDATMYAQPLIYTDAGKLTGCGLRVVGVVVAAPGARETKTFDISINLYTSKIALGKAIGGVVNVRAPDLKSERRLPLYGAWFRAGGDDPFTPVAGSFKPSSNDKGAYLFQSAMEPGLDLILSVLKGDSLQVGLRWDQKTEAIYSGRPELDQEGRRQVAECFTKTFK